MKDIKQNYGQKLFIKKQINVFNTQENNEHNRTTIGHKCSKSSCVLYKCDIFCIVNEKSTHFKTQIV